MSNFIIFTEPQIQNVKDKFIYQFGEERKSEFDNYINQVIRFYEDIIFNNRGTFGELILTDMGIACDKYHQSKNKCESFIFLELGNALGIVWDYARSRRNTTLIYPLKNSIASNYIIKNINTCFINQYKHIWEKFLSKGYYYNNHTHSLVASEIHKDFEKILNDYHSFYSIPIEFNFFNFKMARELPIRKEYFNVEQFENFIEHEYKQKYSVLENIVTFWKLRKKMNNKNY